MNVQIPMELFIQLIKYHVAEFDDAETAEMIKKGLSDKLDQIAKRELYSKYKNKSLTAEEREQARLEYLDKVGIHKDFRW